PDPGGMNLPPASPGSRGSLAPPPPPPPAPVGSIDSWRGPITGPATGPSPGLVVAPELLAAEPVSSRRYLKIRSAGRAFVLLALISLAVWMGTESRALASLALACIGALAVDAFLAMRGVRSAEISLTPTGDAVSDEPTRWLLRVDDLPRPVSLQAVRLPKPEPVLAEQGRPGVISVPPTARGIVHFLVIDAVCVGPIGLFQAGRRHRVTPPAPLVVRPRPVPVHIRWPMPRAVGFGLSETAPRGDDLFRSVRPYQRGDERRKIHWKSTAHHGELMVREDDGTGVVALQVIVHLHVPGPAAERAIGNAAWLTEAAIQRGWLVQLVTLDDTPPAPRMPVIGSPFGAIPVTTPAPHAPPQTLAQMVRSVDEVRRQLATAVIGQPASPPWKGLSCVVDERGVQWP
ncbi:MAG: DUF58 domain-containing protein, partial [Acidimicrobiales bacterium]|nr:DUF58 domain-containing protein [Acidimicrobiales bacterium]